jgi:hypothetical protein
MTFDRSRRMALAALALATSGWLAGCAGPYLMDNTVQSYSTLQAVPQQAGYRFERLPSQQADPNQPRLEGLATAALDRAGLRRDDAGGRYVVQAWARVQRGVYPWARSGWGGLGWSGVGFASQRGLGVGLGVGAPIGGWDTPWYQREVGLVMRDGPGGPIVYETHAYNDGPWLDPDLSLAAMFDASMQGFPTPPAGLRRVDIRLVR